MPVPTLRKHAEAILGLVDRPRVRALVRVDQFDRFVSVLVFVPRDRYDSVVREKIGTYLKTVFDGRLSAYYPAFPEGGLARVHFIIGRSGGKTPEGRAGDDRGGDPRHRADLGGCAARGGGRPPAPMPALTAIAAPLPRELSRLLHARRWRWPMPDASPRSAPTIRSPSTTTGPCRPDAAAGVAEDLSSRRAGGAVAARADPGEYRLPRHQRAHLRGRRRRRPAWSSSTTWNWRTPTASRSTWPTAARCSRTRSCRSGAATSTMTATTAWPRPPACGRGEITILRAYGRYLQQAGIPQSQDFIAAALNRYPDIARGLHRAVRRPLRPAGRSDGDGGGKASQGQDQGRAGGRAEHRRRHHHPPLPQPDRGLAAHQSFRRRYEGEGPVAGDQARFARDRRPARAAAMARDLRLRVRGRGRASALRPGGARRPALVGPRPGLPHRGARPGQGAAGQERRHRAGRRQGRLLPEAACRRAAAATRSSRPARAAYKNFVSQPACRSPTISAATVSFRRPASCGATATIPISSSPPTRARRPSPTPPTPSSAGSTASGSTTPSPRGGSAGYDHKKMGITATRRLGGGQAAFPRDEPRHPDDAVHRRRRRRHVGRRVRQRHAAVADRPG